jgi:dienelactone hydrolase
VKKALAICVGAAALIAGCGSGDLDEVRAKTDYDQAKRLPVEEVSRGDIFTEIEFQSPRGNDVLASIVLPPHRTGKVPAVLWAHAYMSNRNEFSAEVTQLADHGIASIIFDSNMTRGGGGGIDVQDPVYAGEVFEALLRQDVVDARVALDILERRPEIDSSRIGFVGVDYGAMLGGILSVVEPRIDAFVLAAASPEPSRYFAHQLVPPESVDGFAERMSPYDTVHLLGKTDKPILLQNARRDSQIEEKDYDRLIDATDGADVKWYDSDHALDFQAEEDRAVWLEDKLGVASDQ